MMSENKCRVSVVVPTFKRHALLTRCLTALMAQDFDATDYEIIIVDDAACDETRKVVEDMAGMRGLAGIKDLAGTSPATTFQVQQDLAGTKDLAGTSPATTFQVQQAKCSGVINHARTACSCEDASYPA